MSVHAPVGTVLWLRAGDARSACVARLEVIADGREVVALTGAASFTRFDANEAWRSLQARGFRLFDGTLALLRGVIRD